MSYLLLHGDLPSAEELAEFSYTITRHTMVHEQLAEDLGLGLGKLAQPLRAALTGQTTSPGIFDVLVLLGRDESLARIADSAATASANQV